MIWKSISCPNCPNDDTYRIVEVTDDYVTLLCPVCGFEFAIAAAQDLEK